MRQRSIVLAFAVFLLSISAASLLYGQTKRTGFIPADIDTAGDLSYPLNSAVSGLVAVEVRLDSAGKIKETQTLRDIPSLTAPVLLSVNSWTFKPALLGGKPVDSSIIVNVVFNPGDYRLRGATTPGMGNEMRAISPDENGFLPPIVDSSQWAEYPLNSTAQGQAIFDCHVSASGVITRVTAVSTVESVQPLTSASIRAAKNWKFTPAKLNAMPVGANVVVGYVFRPPNIATPLVHP